jgi:prepilin-type N-terminal cleavage/methylation domain-containing protein
MFDQSRKQKAESRNGQLPVSCISLPLNSVCHAEGECMESRKTHSAFCLLPSAFGGRRAFTLVEMLVVITIIGILVSLGSVAVFKALEAAHRSRIKTEITNLESAVQAYKQKYGDFPPSYINNLDPISVALVTRHLTKAFPRCNPAIEIAVMPASMSGANALVFWLTSITKDPAHPLSAVTTDRQTFFDFDKTRLSPSPGGWTVSGTNVNWIPQVYIPQSGKTSPYYYFDARSYLQHSLSSAAAPSGVPVPYLLEPWDTNTADGKLDIAAGKEVDLDSSNNMKPASFQALCANPKSFQIISAGLDGDYGTVATISSVDPATGGKYNGATSSLYFKSYPSGLGYDSGGADDDNITNFSESALGDAKP